MASWKWATGLLALAFVCSICGNLFLAAGIREANSMMATHGGQIARYIGVTTLRGNVKELLSREETFQRKIQQLEANLSRLYILETDNSHLKQENDQLKVTLAQARDEVERQKDTGNFWSLSKS